MYSSLFVLFLFINIYVFSRYHLTVFKSYIYTFYYHVYRMTCSIHFSNKITGIFTFLFFYGLFYKDNCSHYHYHSSYLNVVSFDFIFFTTPCDNYCIYFILLFCFLDNFWYYIYLLSMYLLFLIQLFAIDFAYYIFIIMLKLLLYLFLSQFLILLYLLSSIFSLFISS